MDVDEFAWIDAFVSTMNGLGATAQPRVLADMAMAYYLTHGDSDPVKVARWRVDQLGLPRDANWRRSSDRNRRAL